MEYIDKWEMRDGGERERGRQDREQGLLGTNADGML